MTTAKEKIVSKRQAKRHFTSVGLVLIVYSLIVLFFPIAINYYFEFTNSSILNDTILYYGIYFIILLLGTFVPFFLLKLISKIPTKRIFKSVKASFSDLFVQTIVFFAACTALIYVSNIILNNLGFESVLLSSVGLNYSEANLTHPIYIFMLVIVTPFIEEYAFRGVLLNSLGKYGKHFALIASSIIFALAHTEVGEIIPSLAMGILLGKTALRYKSIQPTIIIHILFNAFLYGLCVIPEKIAQYMAYGIAVVCIFALYLVLTKRYKPVRVQKLRSNKITNIIFYCRPAIIITIVLMIGHIVLFAFKDILFFM